MKIDIIEYEKNTTIIEDIELFLDNINVLNRWLNDEIKQEEELIDKLEIKLNKIIKEKETVFNELEDRKLQLKKQKLISEIIKNIYSIVKNMTYLSNHKKNELIELIDKLDTLTIDKLESQNKHFIKLLEQYKI